MDAADRSCTVSVHCSSHRVKVLVKFPAQYPNNAAPSFQFINPTTITSTMKAKLLKVGIRVHLFSLLFVRELCSRARVPELSSKVERKCRWIRFGSPLPWRTAVLINTCCSLCVECVRALAFDLLGSWTVFASLMKTVDPSQKQLYECCV